MGLEVEDSETGSSIHEEYKNYFFIREYDNSHKLRENTADPRNSTGFE